MHRSHTSLLNGALLSSALLVLSNLALAQDAAPTPAPADPAPVAPADPAAAPAPAPSVEGEAPAPPACYPPCREGFLCNAGACISACNPACPAGQRCNGEAQCVADVAPAPPPPSYPELQPPGDEPPPPEPGRHRHDGFLLRGTIGLGGGAMAESSTALGDVDYTGGGYSLSLDLGGAISEDRFSVFGRFAMFSLANPHWESDGADGNLSEQNITSVLLGGGASYHLMPINMYFALAAGIGGIIIGESQDSENDGDTNGSSKVGIAGNLDIGKEWWVAPQAGIGVALRLWVGTGGFESDTRSTDLDRSFIGGALLFSITYQ